MPPGSHNSPRLRILSVGGNAISAFLSWRLSATNACDVTLVWKSGFESVAQYGISFRSSKYGNERFKPRLVVRSPEEAAHAQKGAYDYVLLCIKALPDVYDLASVIEPVVTPQHTCILINTSHSLGVEAMIEKRFPQNVVLSLVSEADISQLGPSEFEHMGGSDVWVGPANPNPEIPQSIQADMAAALAMTLGTGQVDCKVSNNIQQQQFERMVGPVAFHTASVVFENPNHAELLELTGVRELISDTIDEMVQLGRARGCNFDEHFKERTMEEMIVPKEANSIMFQDFSARRPMEVETYLGSPVQLAKQSGVKVPRIDTLYALMHHINIANQQRKFTEPKPPTPGASGNATPRMQYPPPRGQSMNGNPPIMNGGPPPPGMRPGRGSRAPSMTGPPPPMRRGPPSGMNGYPGGPRGPPPVENGGLDEFSHLVMYDTPEDGFGSYSDAAPASELAIRERELMLRQKELALREREMNLRGGPPTPRTRQPASRMGDFDEDDDDDGDYFDPMSYRGPPVNPDNVDMMSITSRRNRKAPSMIQLRGNPEGGGPPGNRRSNLFSRPGQNRNRQSSQLTQLNTAGMNDSIMDNPLLGYSSDRYGALDRSNLGREGRESRAGSLTTARLNELSQGGTAYGGYPPMARRTSQSPGHPMGGPPPPGHAMGPNGMPMNGMPMSGMPMNGMPPNGMHSNGRPSPPNVRQPTPRHPPGHGNAVAPQQVENRAGVSNYPPKSAPQVRSLTGSASASAGSGDSGRSAHVSAENSAYSSQSSLGARPPIGVR